MNTVLASFVTDIINNASVNVLLSLLAHYNTIQRNNKRNNLSTFTLMVKRNRVRKRTKIEIRDRQT